MAGLVPAIHVLICRTENRGCPALRPGMTGIVGSAPASLPACDSRGRNGGRGRPVGKFSLVCALIALLAPRFCAINRLRPQRLTWGHTLSLFAAGIVLFVLLIASYSGRGTWVALGPMALSAALLFGGVFLANVHDRSQM